MDQAQDISNKIVQLVREAPGGTMLGVRLGASLRAYFPSFYPYNYRCRNLRHFIQKYVPTVFEKGRAGADLVYTTVSDAPIQDTFPPVSQDALSHDASESGYVRLPTNPYIWKAYSNPSHPFIVGANRETGAVHVFPEGTTIAEPMVLMPKPTAEIHSEIAKEFTSTLPEPLQTSLGALLDNPKWYVRFSSVAMRNHVGPKWAAFRRGKLIERFNSSLRELAIPTFTHPTRVLDNPVHPAPQRPAQPTIGIASEESGFRDLVSKVISELPLAELRSLKLPVGAVFDALKRQG
jgi:hypothetical protein